MKKLFAIALIVVALVLLVPGVIGYQAEARYQELVDELAGAGFQVTDNQYRRGWFGAEAVTEFRLLAPLAVDAGATVPEAIRFVVRSQVSHGPLTSQGVGLAEIDSIIEVDGEPLLGDNPAAPIITMIAIDGTGHTRIQIAERELVQQPDEPAVRFLGMTGSIDFDLEAEKARFRFQSPGIRVQRDDRVLVEVTAISLDSQTWRGQSGLMLGKGQFSVDRIVANDPDLGDEVELQGLMLQADSSEGGERSDLVTVAVEYHLKSLKLQGQEYTDGLLRLELDRLYAPVLVQIQKTTEQIQSQQLSEAETGLAMMSLLMNRAPDLLKRNPSITLQPIRLTTPSGLAEAGLSLQSRGLTMADFSNQQALLHKIEAKASLRLPETLFQRFLLQQNRVQLEQQLVASQQPQGEEPEEVDQENLNEMAVRITDEQLKQWLEQGLVRREGTDITTQVTLAGGRLTVNGKEIPLPGR